jgi:mannose-1-phosphate guanylyltransferase
VAERYAASGNHYWNAGMFFWRASTYLQNLERFLPKTRAALESLAAYIGKRNYDRKLRAIYPKLENISVDYAILEPATRQTTESSAAETTPAIENASVFVIPAEVGWSDIGSWAAVYELLAKTPAENVLAGPGQTIDSAGNFVYSPKKFVAAIGVTDLVVVDTPDALLIVPRHRAQDVAGLVKLLEQQKRTKLL